jgi:membrane protein required for colicin V production
MPFNWLDVLLAAVVLLAVVVGLVKGFVRELVGLIIIFVGIVVAARFYGPMASFTGKLIKNPVAAKFVGFLLLFLAVLIAGGILAGLIARMTKGSLGFANHLLGGVIGCLEGVLVAGAVVFALLAFPVQAGPARLPGHQDRRSVHPAGAEGSDQDRIRGHLRRRGR